MRIEAKTAQELIKNSGKFSEDMAKLDKFIVKTAPTLKRVFYNTPTINHIGYGEVAHKKGVYPLISISPQKNSISIYVTGLKDGLPLPAHYKSALGRVNTGKSCIRFTKIENLNLDVLKQVILDAITWQKNENKEKNQ